jgi:ankyrin repeat protein
MKTLSAFITILSVCMQDGRTAAYAASINGHTETLALLLANKVDVNSAVEVKPFKSFSCL